LLLNLVLIAVLLFLARRYRKPGALMATYLFGYCITQFIVFFARASEPLVKLGGVLDWGLKQAQWTAIIFAIVLIPITILAMRSHFARPVPAGEAAATYGMPEQEATPNVASLDAEDEPSEEAEAVAQPASVGADGAAQTEEKEVSEEAES
jgi:phosphatidylglycerol:prolipoprotein diacylglycerol transferase